MKVINEGFERLSFSAFCGAEGFTDESIVRAVWEEADRSPVSARRIFSSPSREEYLAVVTRASALAPVDAFHFWAGTRCPAHGVEILPDWHEPLGRFDALAELEY